MKLICVCLCIVLIQNILCQSVVDLLNQQVGTKKPPTNSNYDTPPLIRPADESNLFLSNNGPTQAPGGNPDENPEDIDDIIANLFPITTTTTTTESIQTNIGDSGNGGTDGFNLNPTPNKGAETGEFVPGCGECTPYYLCRNNTIITNGEGLLDIRMKNGPCKSYFDTCCPIEDKLPVPTTTERPVEKPRGCGIRNEKGVGFRITGDKDSESQFGEFPWMIAVLLELMDGEKKINAYQCGGSLIHPKVVMTAAHCIPDEKLHRQMKVRAGEWDTQTKNEIYPHQDRKVVNIVKHEQYHRGALFNDVALLILDRPLEIAENIDVVCLPPPNFISNDTNCFASGWGKDVFGREGTYQVILKKVELPMVAHNKCQKLLRNTRLGHRFELHKSFVCAGGELGPDTCKGDGGSPLVCPVPGHPGRYQQIGIVAWGIGCGGESPGVYVNVAHLRDWIDEQIVYNNLDRSSYLYD